MAIRPPVPVIDIHVHIQPWEELKPEVRERMRSGRESFDELEALMRDPDRVLRLMDEAGIERIGIINYVSPDLMGFTDKSNVFSAETAKHAPDRFVAFGSVHPRFCERRPGEEVERLHGLGIRALKIHPPHQLFAANAYLGELPGLAEVYGKAEELGMPVMVHTGTSVFPGARNRFADPMPCDDVAVDFPKLKLILAHAGRPLYMDTCFFLARRHPNLTLDLSGIPPRRLLHYLPRLTEIADKLLWGTDWPGPGVPDMGKTLGQFLELDLPDDVRRKILRDNACRVFGWGAEPSRPAPPPG